MDPNTCASKSADSHLDPASALASPSHVAIGAPEKSLDAPADSKKEQFILYKPGARVSARWGYGFTEKLILYPATITNVTRNSIGEAVAVSLLFDDQCTRDVKVDELRPEIAATADEAPMPTNPVTSAVISDVKTAPQTVESDSKTEDERNKYKPVTDASSETEAPPSVSAAEIATDGSKPKPDTSSSPAATDDKDKISTDGQVETDTKADDAEKEEEGEEEEGEEEEDEEGEEEEEDDKERRNCCCACEPLRVATDRLLWITAAFMFMWVVLATSLAANNRPLTDDCNRNIVQLQSAIPVKSIIPSQPITPTFKVDEAQLLSFRSDLLSTISNGLTAAATSITKQCAPSLTPAPAANEANSCRETFARHFDFTIKSRGTSFTTPLRVGDYIHSPDCKKIVIMQEDCNFVMYDGQKKALWATGTRKLGTECDAFIMCDKDSFCAVCVGYMKSDGELGGSCPSRRYRGKSNAPPAFGFHQGDATSFL